MQGANVVNSLLEDTRVNCFSLMSTMEVGTYLSLVEPAYRGRGGLRGQREPLKTTTAKRIRSRMVNDIVRGALLPPIVIGVVISSVKDIEELRGKSDAEIISMLNEKWVENLSIIDGMQRTTALLDAIADSDLVSRQPVRVEIWFSHSTDNLIYRMLVLNTGQVPWNLKHQLQVVYAPLIAEMAEKVRFERLLTLENSGRRTKGGEFSADNLVEAYLTFGLRRIEIDTQETLADEFSRLDIAETLALDKYNKFFYPIVQAMVDLDKAFSRLDEPGSPPGEDGETTKFVIGRNIFDSQPARIGFVVACAIAVLGRIGMDKTADESEAVLVRITGNVGDLTRRLQSISLEELKDFLSLEVLSERIKGVKRSAIGRYDRAFFEKGFKVLIEENFNVPSLDVCWRT
jgi:hypothetical protein